MIFRPIQWGFNEALASILTDSLKASFANAAGKFKRLTENCETVLAKEIATDIMKLESCWHPTQLIFNNSDGRKK